MQDSENNPFECFNLLNERLDDISVLRNLYEPILTRSILESIREGIWQTDLRITRVILQDFINQIQELESEIPELFKSLDDYLNRFDNKITREQIQRRTLSDLDTINIELNRLLRVVLRKLQASLPKGIDKDGFRLKIQTTEASLVALFKAFKKSEIIDKDLPSIELAKFIALNFSTQRSSKSGLSIKHLEDLIADESTSSNPAFLSKLKKSVKILEG